MRILLLAFVFVSLALSQTRTVELSWDHSDPAGSVTFNVYRADVACTTPSPTFTKINTAPITVKTYTNAAVPYGTYCYYVKAFAASLESNPSNLAPLEATPHDPTNLRPVVVGE